MRCTSRTPTSPYRRRRSGSGETGAEATLLTVSRCRYGFDRSTPKDCKAIRTVDLGGSAGGKTSVEDLPPDDYDLALCRNGARATERIALRGNATASLALDPPVVTGSIRRDGKPLAAALSRSRGRRVVVRGEVHGARIFAAAGPRVLAVAGVQDDGAATLPASVPAGATLYLVSLDYPLMRFPMPEGDGELFLPAVTATPISIMLPATSPHGGGPIGLELDGEVLPSEVFFSHQALHKLPVQIRSGETMTLAPRDLAAIDPFANPAALRQMYRRVLTGASVVLRPDR